MKLWTAQTISLLGSAITTLALPLTAITLLHANPLQIGILFASGQISPLLVGLFIGVWVDRLPRRPLLIMADLGRAALLALIPLLSIFHVLQIEMLYLINFLVGILNVLFGVAASAFLPSLIAQEQLIEGNSNLQLSRSTMQIVGPNLAGALLQFVTAPIAIIGDVISFLCSALCLAFTHEPEYREKSPERTTVFKEIGIGLHIVLHHPILRALAASNFTANIFWSAQMAMFLLYMIREVDVPTPLIGLIFAVGNSGLLIGTILARYVVRWLGLGPTLILTPLISDLGALLIPFASRPLPLATGMLITAQFFILAPLIIFEVNQVSLRQSCTPEHVQGRVSATMQFIGWATVPLGGLLGGWLGAMIGLRLALLLVSIGLWSALPWLIWSPLRTLRELPAQNTASLLPSQRQHLNNHSSSENHDSSKDVPAM
ncbi:MFS transporter [Reticulibacter mediterranei]|uniref:MFS transporter n=2 Tax=Reticulibacter mediterranei TaxID=2778369 RepID=A0A8J3N3A4_9CHLR|nr:MFS transporter [Reticulibacter mediterranei]